MGVFGNDGTDYNEGVQFVQCDIVVYFEDVVDILDDAVDELGLVFG